MNGGVAQLGERILRTDEVVGSNPIASTIFFRGDIVLAEDHFRTKIKICGITNKEDAWIAVDIGVDALGFIFTPHSSRQITPIHAQEIISTLPPFITTVGVWVDEDPARVKEIAAFCGLNILQFHGNESPSYCQLFSQRTIKAFRIHDETSLEIISQYKTSAYLLDTYVADAFGGTGKIFNWALAKQARSLGKIILAGGLTADNISEAIKIVRPYAVDVSSGVEILPGKKDPVKLKDFVKNSLYV